MLKYNFPLCWWLIALFAPGGSPATHTQQIAPNLLIRSMCVKNMGDPEVQGMWAMPRWPFAYWLPAARLLYFYKGYRHGDQSYFEWRIYNVKTGFDTCPHAFNSLFQRLDGSEQDFRLSPNGRIAFWQASDHTAHLLGATLDSKRQFDFKRGYKHFDLTWLPDSRRWIEWEVSETSDRFVRAHVYALDGSGGAHLLRTLPIAATCPIVPDWFATHPIVSPGSDDILRVEWTEKRKRNAAQIQVFPLNGILNTPAVTYNLRLPSGAEVRDCVVSPGRDRIAWLLEMPAGVSTPQERHRKIRLTSKSTLPKATLSLWVSRSNGADLRILGSAALVDNGIGGYNPAGLRWLPDGKQVSFTARQWLWTLKVDLEADKVGRGSRPKAMFAASRY
jgi:hypothetical protein